jgi:ferredoxin
MYKIINTHECKWANEHQAVRIVEYQKEGWTLFVDHSKLEHEGEEEDMEYRIAIEYCPFCGNNLTK